MTMIHRRATSGHGAGPKQATRGLKPVIYPESDGKPMGETELHIDELIRLLQILRSRFRDDPNVYVGGDLILYYEEGNPRASVVPDAFVAKGAANLPRRDTYLFWQEQAPPTVVIEVTSRSTSRVDRTKKWELYARLGVREYILYDPRFAGLETRYPPLQGYRLVEGRYEPLPVDDEGALVSQELDLRLRVVDGRLGLFDVASGIMLRGPVELLPEEQARAEAEYARAEAEILARRTAEARASEAEARIAQLEARLAERLPPSPH